MGASTRAGQALLLQHLPTGRPIRIAGMSDDQLAVCLDPLPEAMPVVVRYRVAEHTTSPADVVDDVLERLAVMACELFPTWLPTARSITTDSDHDRRVIRQLAHELASGTEHFGPFLADVAEAALGGRIVGRGSSPEIRARGLARIIGDAYSRNGVALLVGRTEAVPVERQMATAAALEWLASYVGVWCGDGALDAVDRFPIWQVAVPDFVARLIPSSVAHNSPRLDYPPPSGLPHPASVAEQELERRLATRVWAVGRKWNQTYASHVLAPPIRIDLMWPDARCAVEIDGPDHRGMLKYAQDRRRDNGLVLDGYAVLRFTNDEIADDPQRVLDVIERLLISRRGGGTSA